jgi:hypothetical protein
MVNCVKRLQDEESSGSLHCALQHGMLALDAVWLYTMGPLAGQHAAADVWASKHVCILQKHGFTSPWSGFIAQAGTLTGVLSCPVHGLLLTGLSCGTRRRPACGEGMCYESGSN